MERPWLLLYRVLHVDPLGDAADDLHADAEEHAGVAEAEADADAQAQVGQHAGVGEAEEHVAVVDVAAEVQQAQHAAVAEAEEEAHAADAQAQAEEDAQAQEEQHAGLGEAEEHAVAAVDAAVEAQDEQQAAVGDAEEEEEEYPQAQLEESVVNVNTDAAASEAAHGPGEPDFNMSVAPPPWVSFLIAGPDSHPDRERPDMYPYIVATGRFCILVHFAVAPSYGTNFDQVHGHSHLIVVRHFLWDDDDQIAACAVDVPDRPVEDFVNIPPLCNIESVGLVCNQETGHYQIAELIVTTGAPQSVVVHMRSDTGIWERNGLGNPLLGVNCLRDWVPHGTVTISSTVLWHDLSWGIIGCDLAQPPPLQVLNFHSLPPGRVLHAGARVPDLHCRRCIAVSENLVRYVEIILNTDQAATVNMWYGDVEGNPPWRWETNYSVSFEDIWEHESYAETELPWNPPMLVGVSPVDCNVVYFSLNQRLFGVNLPEHTVVDCQQYEPLHRPGPPNEPATSRYFITWNLHADGAPNVGHQPDDPSDHGDSSGSGSADDGEIDYVTPPE